MKKYRIILVENDEDEQFFMKQGFDQTDLFEILTQASNGYGLLEWLDTHTSSLPDLILSDLNMPGKNGYEVLEAMQNSSIYGHVPVIITSTSSTRSIIDKCLALGAADYVVKPDTFLEYDTYSQALYERIELKHLVKSKP
jgi:CheY-like chemotaxis protein